MAEHKILIGIPTVRGQIDVEVVKSLIQLDKPEGTKIGFLKGSLINKARNQFADEVIDEKYDYLLFLDDDQIFPSNTITNLLECIDNGADIACGLYVTKDAKHEPTAYIGFEEEGDKVGIHIVDFSRKHLGNAFEVDAHGTGCMLIKREVLENVRNRYGTCFEFYKNLGEDLSFCFRARKLDYKILCDTRMNIGHLSTITYTIEDYLKIKENK